VFGQACPLFVPLVEEGWFNKKVTLNVAQEYLGPLRKAKIDTLILGCTHYPLLKTVLSKVMGPKVMLIDSAQEVAYDVENLLDKIKLSKDTKTKAHHDFLVSDEPKHFRRLARRFLGYNINAVRRVASG
jgi:glutamate racemase